MMPEEFYTLLGLARARLAVVEFAYKHGLQHEGEESLALALQAVKTLRAIAEEEEEKR